MKKLLSVVVSLVAALYFTGIAAAIPANDQMNKSISTLESEDKGAPEASKPKDVQKQKKAPKRHRKAVKKQAAPASSQAPATSPGASSTPAAPASK